MTLREDLLPLMDLGGEISDALGLSPYTLTVRRETYDGPPCDGAQLLTIEPPPAGLVITPNPSVTLVGRAPPSWLAGGGIVANVGAWAGSPIYRVGAITYAYPGGGYAVTDVLMPIENASQRIVYWLTGPDLVAGGEPFQLYQGFAPDPRDMDQTFGFGFLLERAPIFDPNPPR